MLKVKLIYESSIFVDLELQLKKSDLTINYQHVHMLLQYTIQMTAVQI